MFTDANRIKIRKYLGWPAYRVTNTALESAIDECGSDVDAQAAVESVLTSIASVETEMAALHPIALAEKVEESTLNRNRYRDLRAAGRRECEQLAILLGTSVARDAFAGGGLTGVVLPWGS